ncbi:TGF-beta family member glass bottom boat [Lycorma delicatula]|uniref:TGF-beta family member glass bottom boat n=1 Tax=Lycorma delicatula TaxID=130591 RepID=UPI003F510C6B
MKCVIVSHLWLSYFTLLCSATLSGLYVDNGIDQTVMQKVMTKQEKKDVEHEILNLLGLETRPRPVANSKTLGSSAPKFLLDVYKSLLDSPSGRTTRSEFNLSGRDLHAIDESDAIMSFVSQNRHVPGVRHERGKRLWFDVSEVPPDEAVVGAELRLYQTSNYSTHSDDNFTVTVYQVLFDDDGQKELEYVDSTNTTINQEGWRIFNLTGPLISWIAFPNANRGLYLSVHQSGKQEHEMRPEDIGIVSTVDKGEVEKQPFMVAFLKSSGGRRVRKTREARRKKKTEHSETSYSRNPLLDSPSHWSTRSCQIQTLFVSFRDLEWQNWIIAPEGYSAYYCSGECNFPLNAHMNATNHAIVQTLVHLMNPIQVPKPCCAPTKLTPISVLYFLDETNVILKKYRNMVVKSCGCH